MSKIVVIGAGSFGFALAYVFSKKKSNRVFLKTRKVNDNEIGCASILQYVRVTTDYAECKDASYIVLALPTQKIPEIIQDFIHIIPNECNIVLVNKGILQENTLQNPFVYNWIQLNLPHVNTYVLSGPNFASEISQDLPTAATLAGENADKTVEASEILGAPLFRLYPSTDVIGVSLAGAIKNIYAIACGICQGLNLGENARAALVTRALAESKRLGCAMGAKSDTFLGLAGVGDLLLSCCSSASRNMSLGLELSQGKTLSQINAQKTQLTEGVFTAKALQSLLSQYQIRMPIATAVYNILYNGITVQQSMQQLLNTLSVPFEHE